MTITCRRYRLLSDFEPVNRLLRHNFAKYQLSGNIPQPFWEYAHTHPWFSYPLAHRNGIWEEDGEIVGVACFEMNVGECYFITKTGYDFLKPEMLDYAEQELSKQDAGQRSLEVRVHDYEDGLRQQLLQRGYQKVYSEPIRVYDYDAGFPERSLPEGYSLHSLEEENDIRKINHILWRGFNHGDEPDDDLDSRWLMQSGPHFRKELTVVIKAPDGEYACYAGMWVDGVNDYAYLEPLCTDPQHRGLGLATIAIAELMKRTAREGATYCTGGVVDFYPKLGFKTVCQRELWSRTWTV
ncbi:GNAT family N-acetyltransferase ['Paenibacillus yunnanensis' Narsing Rao et al. 2020]|uniref:GNAT family N-acetyltransferase n=1 Tax=Paenibacillus tengchongensis TaxID=2608684 RepID=UPI00124DCA37|nr:GNAT family N-acetyltransferase [Paenibacillus tengchongensis]